MPRSESAAARVTKTSNVRPQNGRSANVQPRVANVQVLGDSIERAMGLAAASLDAWRGHLLDPDAPPTRRWLAHVPDVGPACEVIIADRLFHDLEPAEHDGLMDWIRGSQDPSGAWLDLDGRPDLSLTALGWWARATAGDDPNEESMVRARRVVHALGGVQRANFSVRLWLAVSGQIPWDYLPAIPGELFLLPEQTWLSPARFSPWARGVLTPYYVIARAPGRIHLADATPLLLQRHPETTVTPRLTRPGLAGDLLQAFDRTVKLSRKFPRGALPRWAVNRAANMLDESRQQHGGWFSFRPTLLSIVALRVLGVSSDDPRIVSGLAYLRRSRGLARIRHGIGEGEMAMAQGISCAPLTATAGVLSARPEEPALNWLLRQEIQQAGPWQARADCSAGGWPCEPGAGFSLDLEATCAALDCLGEAAGDGHHRTAAWGATRRATDVLLAMQESAGGFSRFERGESRVFMRNFPWTDADLLASGAPDDGAHVNLTARVLTQLGRLGFRLDDDRVERGVRWLERTAADEHDHRAVPTLANLARCAATVCPTGHPLRQSVERRLRARQREDGSFGSVVETSLALRALLDLGPSCVQAVRAARHIVDAVTLAGNGSGDRLAHGLDRIEHGLGLSPACVDPSAAAREAYLTLARAREALDAPSGTNKR